MKTKSQDVTLPSVPDWVNPVTGALFCSNCGRSGNRDTVFREGWEMIFTKHPAQQEHPLLICVTCRPDWLHYGWTI